VETTASDANRIFALGNYSPTADRALLEQLTRTMRNAERIAPSWIAAKLKKTINEIRSRYPDKVGHPSFFAAIGEHGAIPLLPEFPAPTPQELPALVGAHMTFIKHLVTQVKETAFSGTTRFFLGSVTTPAQGFPDTTGNSDGGNAAQYGMLSTQFLGAAKDNSPALGGNGVRSNVGSITDGSFGTFATLTVTGNSSAANVSQANVGPVALNVVRKPESITAKVLYDIPMNTLNGANSARAIVTLEYIDSAGTAHQTNVGIWNQGQTVGKTVASISVPVDSASIALIASVQTLASDTTGTLTMRVYEFWAEVVE